MKIDPLTLSSYFVPLVLSSKQKLPRTNKAIGVPASTAFINLKQHSLYRAIQLRGGADNSNALNDTGESSEMKTCRCVLCGEEIVASCQEDCVAHMAVCPAFTRVHPENGKTNPNGVYSPPANNLEASKTQIKDIQSMSVKELKKLISQAGLSDSDCIEKKDLQARARDALALQLQP
jgi:hypothetical protein